MNVIVSILIFCLSNSSLGYEAEKELRQLVSQNEGKSTFYCQYFADILCYFVCIDGEKKDAEVESEQSVHSDPQESTARNGKLSNAENANENSEHGNKEGSDKKATTTIVVGKTQRNAKRKCAEENREGGKIHASPPRRANKTRKSQSDPEKSSANVPVNDLRVETTSSHVELSDFDKTLISAVQEKRYEAVLRAFLSDEQHKAVTLVEVGKHIARECGLAGTEIARMSHGLEYLKMPEYKRYLLSSCPSSVQLIGAMMGKDKILTPAVTSVISILIYVLNSHANLFQKMISTILLHAKCNPATIEKLHTYKLSIAYETLVTFLDHNTELGQVPKLVKAFQLI